MVKRGDIVELGITDLSHDGKGISKAEGGLAVFVGGGVPGDKVKARILRIRKNYAEAKLTEIVKPSLYRTGARCEHFGTCNGCKMQNLNYEEQLKIKKLQVINAFERIGEFKNIFIPDVSGSEDIYFYRNKLEFSFSNNRWLTEEDIAESKKDGSFVLGFHMPKFVDKVLDINNCYLQSEASNKVLNLTRAFFKTRNTNIYSFRTHTGYLRYLIIRNSQNTGEMMVNLITFNENEAFMKEYAECIKKEVPEVTTLTNSISTTKAQAAIGDYYKIIYGTGYIEENIGKFKYKIMPNTFFQTNSKQVKVLFDTAVSFSGFEGNENVLDLYCGCGAISIYISDLVKSVTGVESSSDAIKAAKENAKINSVKNCEFIEYDVKDYLSSLVSKQSEVYDTVILDPPRSGIHPRAADYLIELEPKKIIYVSCNPSTQARDVKLLAAKYDITKIQPVDMFPQTMHTENVVRMDLK